MKLEDIINTYNTVNHKQLIPIRRAESVSAFAPAVKLQSITLINGSNNETVVRFEEQSILDITEKLENEVLSFLFRGIDVPLKVMCVDISKIPAGMNIEEFIKNWEKLQNLVPVHFVEIDGKQI